MSTTSALEFSNLPTDAIGKIIEKCDLKEQLTLRKVSKDLRSLVDEQKSAYKSIAIYLTESFFSCVYNGKNVVYAGMNFDQKNAFGFDYKGCFIRSNDYVKIALNDVAIALNNPKLRLDDLNLTVYHPSPDVMNRFRLLPNSLNHQIHVKTLTVHAGNPEFLLSILPFLKPKMLANIEVLGGGGGTEIWASEKGAERVKKISSLEQWKQAEQLTAEDCFHYFPSEFLMHFKRFVILDWDVTEQSLINLRDFFSTSTNFESCTVESDLDDSSEYLESFCEQVDTGDEDVLLYNYKIPDDSNQILEFKLDYDQQKMIISKKRL
ncbi:hypothetical protein GCK72_021023 [Caenorhabditis remanei]|uniref:F-box domain-containing protein n=1 Tax=Caenorhabditis remanei TaxID=31234 RepID=A0A6A5GH09_CAERE|nr:hypothetical protein GCK72_021023 [Caenorhabditis remanei]KAF1754460.1 hypothetical protein GCK72_021023 [Caenorhabditis remanei]